MSKSRTVFEVIFHFIISFSITSLPLLYLLRYLNTGDKLFLNLFIAISVSILLAIIGCIIDIYIMLLRLADKVDTLKT